MGRYSNGQSEVVLGRAIKAIGMPRESVVVMTKVRRQLECALDGWFGRVSFLVPPLPYILPPH